MEQIQVFGDDRLTGFCVYCGGETQTRDHVPSKIFLSKKYPDNLPVVSACEACNQSFSIDEEYLACLIECSIAGSVCETDIQRKKIRRILKKKPALKSRLAQARNEIEGTITFNIEKERVENIVLKLARGHAAYELHDPHPNEPCSVSFVPLTLMRDEERDRSEATPESQLWPEVGSRALQRAACSIPDPAEWIIVQGGKYRYLAFMSDATVVRIVIREYLGCEVVWT